MSRFRLIRVVSALVLTLAAMVWTQSPASAGGSSFTGTLKVGETLTPVVSGDTYFWAFYTSPTCGGIRESQVNSFTDDFLVNPAAAGMYLVLYTFHGATPDASACVGPVEAGPFFTGDLVVGSEIASPSPVTVFNFFDDDACASKVAGPVTGPVTLAAEQLGLYVQASFGSSPATCVGPVVAAPFGVKPTVSADGDFVVGETVTAHVVGGIPDAADTSKTYQWLADGSPIGGATESSLEVPPTVVGSDLSVAVTSASAGFVDDVTTSEPVAVAKGSFTVADPTITGDPQVGQTLTCASDDPEASFAWSADGSPVGAESDYTVGVGDVGTTLTCTITVVRVGYEDATASAQVGPVGSAPAGDFTVSVSGTPVVGKRLRATVVGVDPSATVTWQWLRDGKPVAAATDSVYELQPGDYGHRFRTRATVSQPGHLTGAARSDATDPVGVRDLKLEVSKTRARLGTSIDITVSNLLPGERWTLSFPRSDWSVTGTAPQDGQPMTRRMRIPTYLKACDRRLTIDTMNPEREDSVAITLID